MPTLPRNKKLRSCSTQLRNEPTPQERHLWYDFLRTASPRWNRQRIIGNYIVDFYCARSKLIVELDGGQHYDEGGLSEYDQVRTGFFQTMGLKVLRFTNTEVEQNFSGVCETIQREAAQRS